jgi:hypothetical protein
MFLLQGVAAKDREERIEEQPDADIIICNVVNPETGEILHIAMYLFWEWPPKIIKKDRGTTRCQYHNLQCCESRNGRNLAYSNVSFLGVAATEKKERIEEQPDADIIICNVVYPDTGEILHINVSSQGVVAQEKKENVEEQPDVDIIICNVEDPETGKILHSNVSSAGRGCQREGRKDRGTTRCCNHNLQC